MMKPKELCGKLKGKGNIVMLREISRGKCYDIATKKKYLDKNCTGI